MWLLCTGKWEREKLKQIVICLEKKTASAPKQNWDESFLVPEIRIWEVLVPSNFLKTVESFRLVTEIHICGFSFHFLVSFKLDRSISLTQSYKHFTLVNYASRVVITSKLLIFATRCRFVIYERRGFIRLATAIFYISASTTVENKTVSIGVNFFSKMLKSFLYLQLCFYFYTP